jgi:hypothetical protein
MVALGGVFIPVFVVSPVSVIPPMLHIYIYIYICLNSFVIRKANERSLGTFKQSNAVPDTGTKNYFHVVFQQKRGPNLSPLLKMVVARFKTIKSCIITSYQFS